MFTTSSPAPATHDARNQLPGLYAHTLGGRDSDLSRHWGTCLARSARETRYYTHGWYTAWLATYGAEYPWTGQGHVLVARTDAGRAVGLLPLALAKRRGLRFLSLAGYHQPIRCLLIDTEVAEAVGATFASALLDQSIGWDLLRIGPLEMNTPGHRGFLEALRSRSRYVRVKPLERLIYVRNLPADFDEYQANVMGRSFAKEIQYEQRRLCRAGNVDVRHYHNPTGEEFEVVLRDCRLIEGRSWLPGSEGARLGFATEVDLAFWRKFVASGLPQDGGLDAWVMYFDNRPISFCFSTTAADVRYMIANQYDQEFVKYSTGSILYSQAFEHACKTGVQAVNLGYGFLQYKRRWGGAEEGERVEALVFPRGLKGRCLAAVYKTVKRLRPNWVKPL